tara:strand:- start:356 stop:457 length:102 start_codon:yes stop_codon:yes gene_type:complete
MHWALRDGLECTVEECIDDDEEERPEWDWLKKH